MDKTTPSRRRRARASLESYATVRVAEAAHLCGVQSTTRRLCRAAGFDESAVFQAVIAVTEFAHRVFVESSRDGELELSARRKTDGFSMEMRAAGDLGRELTFAARP